MFISRQRRLISFISFSSYPISLLSKSRPLSDFGFTVRSVLMVSTQQLNPKESVSDSSELQFLSGPKFSSKATSILRWMLSERKIDSFQGKPQRKKEQLDKTLEGLCVTGRLKQAVGLLWRSSSSVSQLESDTYSIILQECINRCEYTRGKRVHAHMVVVGHVPNDYLKVKLVILYALSGDLRTGGILFNGLESKSVVPRNALISGCVKKGLEQEGLFMYYDMRYSGVVPDQYTFSSVFRACSALASLEHGMRVHAVLVKSCLTLNIRVNGALVDMYFKCSSVSDGYRAFDLFLDRNVVTWTSLMSGFGYHGRVTEVLRCFEKMKREGCRPNSVTFLVVLTACSHGGLVEEGRECFESMKRDYGMKPVGQHYAAMVDILGRAGRLQEAYEFVMKSPCKRHAPVWGSLLGACRNHGNVELLELAATKYFELDPTNGGNYVVCANGYASCGLLDAASKVRKRMESAGVKKDPGYSQIELQGEVHKFMRNDTSHRLSRQIHEKVQEMTSLFMDVGYHLDDLENSCPL
ncbi:Pentatricopeptide repeat-containing protein [Hirschfeldia incana]|nr:Pentatricopeptide repeat-containing protein [Hirschfeldia incana]